MSYQDTREAMGIVYCPTCRCDTIPCERTGICFFCDRQLIAVAASRVHLHREREAA